jgi:tetratricopeptide (TPR) repeat protein
MIDVERMESQLQALSKVRRRAARPVPAMGAPPASQFATAPAVRAPSPVGRPAFAPSLSAATARVLARLRVPAAAPEPTDPAGTWTAPPRARTRLLALLEDGDLDEADRLAGDAPSRRERVSWATMRALLACDHAAARAENQALHDLARESRDHEAMDRYWLQHFWLVMSWGTDEERQALAERCRERAYRADDLAWTAALAVLLAQMGKADEALEAFEDAYGRLARAEESIQLDVATNLVEAAALLGDAFLAGRLHYTLVWTAGGVVTVGEGWVCKGAIERFRALGEAAVGMFAEADEDFGRAVARHRALGAEPLLARTLHQWGTTFVGRDDDRAAECFRQADALARSLQMTDPTLVLRPRC